jgi:DNA-binding beta-propeller fold protein YncE
MQPAFKTWAARQAELYALMAGVLAGYSVPSYQYSRYYAFGFQVDKIQRRFGSALTATAEMINVENVWIARGYNIIILDAIRTSVTTFSALWETIPIHLLGSGVCNTHNHNTYWSGADVAGYVAFLDPSSRTWRYAVTTDTFPKAWAACPELGLAYFCSDTSDIVGVITDATPPAVTEQPLAAGDHPFLVAVDYDPTTWPSPVFGQAWVPCLLHSTLYKWRLDGTVAPVAITLPAHGGPCVLDKAKNQLYVVSSNATSIYLVDRVTNAIVSKTPPHAGSACYLDPIHGELWLNCGASAFVMKMDTTTYAFTSYAVGHAAGILRVDPIRRKVYYLDTTALTITEIDGATGATRTIAVGAGVASFEIDPSGCFLMTADIITNTARRIHLISLVYQDYVLDGPADDLVSDPTNHKMYVHVSDGATYSHVYCINP